MGWTVLFVLLGSGQQMNLAGVEVVTVDIGKDLDGFVFIGGHCDNMGAVEGLIG